MNTDAEGSQIRCPRSPIRARLARLRRSCASWPLLIAGLLSTAVLLAPSVMIAWQSVGVDRFIAFPPRGFTLEWYGQISEPLWNSIMLSLKLATITTSVDLVLAIPAGLAIVRSRLMARSAIDTLLRIPLQLPYVVVGIAMLQYFTLLDASLGVGMRGSFIGLLAAHIVITAPFVLASIVTALQTMNRAYEEAAFSLGAGRVETLFRVTLPMLRPSIFAGAFLAFVVSFENVPVSMFLNVGGQNTMPVAVFLLAEVNNSPSLYAFSTAITVVSALLVIAVQRYVGLRSSTRAAGG